MAHLQDFPAKHCFTVAAVLVHEHKVLLIKHKKLGIWLAPGGHVEGDELPHKAAEREFWEETGVKVTAVDTAPTVPSDVAENLPHPFLTNLHWVSRENYEARVNGGDRSEATQRNWGNGCEQHLCFLYLVKPQGSVAFHQNLEETAGIGWFSAEELKTLETPSDVKGELLLAIQLDKKLKEQ